MRESPDRLCRAIGYEFKNGGLLKIALTHRSVGPVNNERLEFLGDSILGFVISDWLFDNFPDVDEGQLSRLRASLVKGDSLAEIGRKLNLGKYLWLGPGELRSGGQSRGSILADTIEAIFAAVYFDGGYYASRQLILNLFEEKLVSINTIAQLKDPKTLLQEYLQARKCELPIYTVIGITGEPHDQLFTVTCEVKPFLINKQGEGCSRRKAEQHAADLCMRHLENG